MRMRTEKGEDCLQKFVKERIVTQQLNLWAPMKKLQLQMWSSAVKKVKLRSTNTIIELREDRALFAQLLVVSKARPEVDLVEAFGEFSSTFFC